jgi:hypothetical protein
MSFQHFPGVGMVHLQEVKRARVVPGPERHKWSRIPQRGQTATCTKCGCQKCYRKDYNVVYRPKGQTEILTERPACSAPAAP